ncbi:MAG: type II toxin-antitoxin system VapC family toxin [Solirubrobacterales bacterium]|nr:type II toxin-antitoxin system VapC family toxin [Solirubrobacterales bacterium]
MQFVIDSSAVMAFLRDEPGADRVAALLESVDSSFANAAFISTVNLAELHQKFGPNMPASLIGTADSVIARADFTARHAEVSGELYGRTRSAGLSLADRACLALATTMELPAITADRAWADVAAGVEVELIR